MAIEPRGEVTPEGFGEYKIVDSATEHATEMTNGQIPIAPEGSIDVRVQVEQSRFRSVGKLFKKAGYVAIAGLVAAGGLYIKDLIEGFSPDSQHKAELAIGAPETKVYEDVYVNVARIDSKFPLTLKTSLDRPGPFNCDTVTEHTGKEGEDKKISTETQAGLIIDELSVTVDGSKVEAVVNGDIHLTKSVVDYDANRINVQGAKGGVDVCVGTHEITAARHIVDVAVQHAGGVAAACALKDPAGESVFDEGLKKFVKTTLVKDNKEKEISVSVPEYSTSVDGIYGQQVGQFEHQVNKVLGDYLDETDGHDPAKLNESDLIDCSKHKITIAEQ